MEKTKEQQIEELEYKISSFEEELEKLEANDYDDEHADERAALRGDIKHLENEIKRIENRGNSEMNDDWRKDKEDAIERISETSDIEELRGIALKLVKSVEYFLKLTTVQYRIIRKHGEEE